MTSVVNAVPLAPGTGAAPEAAFAAVRRRVDAVLGDFLAAKAAGAPDPCLRPVAAAIRASLADGKRLRPVFCHEVMAGQHLDLAERPGGDEWLSRAWRIIGLKTAGYTVERPLQLGAVLAGANEAVPRACSGYGRPLGEAFQLRDDLLGVFGDPGRTGKPVLDDLREGKPTVLMALTWERASRTQRVLLRDRLDDPSLDEDGAAELRELIRATGAYAAVERLVRTRTDQALAALVGFRDH